MITKLKAAGVTTVVFAATAGAARLHQGGHRAGVLPRVGRRRAGAVGPHRVRPHLRPAAVGPRLRRHPAGGRSDHAGERRRTTRSTSGSTARSRRPTTPSASSLPNPALLLGGAAGDGPEPDARDVARRAVRRRRHQAAQSASRTSPRATRASGAASDYQGVDDAHDLLVGSGRDRTRRDPQGGHRHVPVRRRRQALPARRVAHRAKLFDPDGAVRSTPHRRRRSSPRSTPAPPADPLHSAHRRSREQVANWFAHLFTGWRGRRGGFVEGLQDRAAAANGDAAHRRPDRDDT